MKLIFLYSPDFRERLDRLALIYGFAAEKR